MDITRDRIIAIAEDYATLYFYMDTDNLSGCSGSTCPDATVGWKTGQKYCWGGEDTTAQYLIRLPEGDNAAVCRRGLAQGVWVANRTDTRTPGSHRFLVRRALVAWWYG